MGPHLARHRWEPPSVPYHSSRLFLFHSRPPRSHRCPSFPSGRVCERVHASDVTPVIQPGCSTWPVTKCQCPRSAPRKFLFFLFFFLFLPACMYGPLDHCLTKRSTRKVSRACTPFRIRMRWNPYGDFLRGGRRNRVCSWNECWPMVYYWNCEITTNSQASNFLVATTCWNLESKVLRDFWNSRLLVKMLLQCVEI